jgi:hypothetical protein
MNMTGKPDPFKEKGPQWRSGIAEGGIVQIQEQIVYGVIGPYGVLQEPGGKQHHIPGIINDKGFEGGDVLCLQCFDEWLVLWHFRQVKNGPPAWKGGRSSMNKYSLTIIALINLLLTFPLCGQYIKSFSALTTTYSLLTGINILRLKGFLGLV